MVVTADHGVCPNPEVSAAKGLDARRVSPSKLLAGAERVLRDAYGKPAGGEDGDRTAAVDRGDRPRRTST